MKKILTTVLAASMMLLGTNAFAQLSIGAGYLNESNKASISSTSESLGSLNGFYAGFGYDINEGYGFGISTGLYYSYLTGKAALASFSLVSADMTEHALNIPVKAGFLVPVGNNLGGFINLGPTFVCGLSSRVKPLGLSIAEIDCYKGEYLNRFDIMVGGAIGAEISNKIRISVGYDFGMLDQFGAGIKGRNEDGSTKDRSYKLNRNRLTAGVSFMF